MKQIRYATLDDLEQIVEIEKTCFPVKEAATKESLKNRLCQMEHSFWVLEDTIIISFINGMYTNKEDLIDEMYESFDDYNQDGKWFMIFGVDTLPIYQHKGYASLLMEYVIQECEKKNCGGIVLTCKEKLIPFYEQFGYVNEGKSKSIHGDAIWYQMRYKVKKIG